MPPKSQVFLLVVAGGGAGRRAPEANCAGACHPEHAQTPCSVEGNPAVTATEQSTMSPSTGQDVHSLKGTLNPEDAGDLIPSISAACPNLPCTSQVSELQPQAKWSCALGHGRRESGLAGSRAVHPAELTSEMTRFPNSESMLPVDPGTPEKDGQH